MRRRRGAAWAAVLRLRWTAPSKALPHGLSGGTALLIGTVLIAGSLRGSYAPLEGPLLALYATATLANALAGFFISSRAPRIFRLAFQHAAIMQSCLAYYVARFAPWNGPTPPTSVVRMADCAVAMGVLLGIFSMLATSYKVLPAPLVAAVAAGSAGFLLLASYPVQLALGGDEWWSCVQRAYPMQGVGMVGYIYVPATWAFAFIMFGATLWNRGIIGEGLFCGVFLVLVMGTVVCTVLTQEVHIPVVSTQRIYLPCPAPEPGSWRDAAVQRLDFSVMAQAVLQQLRSWSGTAS